MRCRYPSSPFFALGRGHEVAVQVNGHIHVRDQNAAPAMRMSRLAPCVVDIPAHLCFASGRGVSVAIDGHPIHLRDPNAEPAMRTSSLVSCIVDIPAHLFRLRSRRPYGCRPG